MKAMQLQIFYMSVFVCIVKIHILYSTNDFNYDLFAVVNSANYDIFEFASKNSEFWLKYCICVD